MTPKGGVMASTRDSGAIGAPVFTFTDFDWRSASRIAETCFIRADATAPPRGKPTTLGLRAAPSGHGRRLSTVSETSRRAGVEFLAARRTGGRRQREPLGSVRAG